MNLKVENVGFRFSFSKVMYMYARNLLIGPWALFKPVKLEAESSLQVIKLRAIDATQGVNTPSFHITHPRNLVLTFLVLEME